MVRVFTGDAPLRSLSTALLLLAFGGCADVSLAPCPIGETLEDGFCVDSGDSLAEKTCDELICDDGNVCTVDVCDPSAAACESAAVHDGSPCNFDGGPGLCEAGSCVDAQLCAGARCGDDNPCTADNCDPMTGDCWHEPVANGLACDFGEFPGVCQDGVCEDAELCADVSCDDDTSCTTDTCDPQTGLCDHAPRSGTCKSDLLVSVGGELVLGDCIEGECVARACGDDAQCSDDNECTLDSCDVLLTGRCSNTPLVGVSCAGGLGTCKFGVCRLDFFEPPIVKPPVFEPPLVDPPQPEPPPAPEPPKPEPPRIDPPVFEPDPAPIAF